MVRRSTQTVFPSTAGEKEKTLTFDDLPMNEESTASDARMTRIEEFDDTTPEVYDVMYSLNAGLMYVSGFLFPVVSTK